jgi:predicted Zn-dependent protease
MATKRYKRNNKQTKRGRIRQQTHKRRKSAKKWVTAVSSAESTLSRSGSYDKAKEALRVQALKNARRLFGSVREML